MNTVISKPHKFKSNPFPKLMLSQRTGSIILAVTLRDGKLSGTIVVRGTSTLHLGYYYDIAFDAGTFIDFNGTVTLGPDA